MVGKTFLNKVISFCKNHEIEVPDMNDYYFPHGRPRRFFKKLQELNNRFDKVNMELLICMASLNPVNSFAAFDKPKILRLPEFYPNEFTKVDVMKLDFQLQMYIIDLRNNVIFQQVKDLSSLSACAF
uniref:Uncharacterized protein n=1 Tax=Kalanchoe fedtschenkoi TaxID=63787 RepID=A0A7N0UHS9_KALFE